MKYLVTLTLVLISWSMYAQINHWETVVFADDEWQYLVPTQAVDADWNQLDFDDSYWATGRGGFGYGDGDDNTELPPTLSCFMRRTFDINDKELIRQLYFQLDYDDGILIYLNGEPIVRRNLTGRGPVAYNYPADDSREATFYADKRMEQAFVAGQRLDDLLREGKNVLAVQVHNESLISSDLTARVWLHAAIKTDQRDYRPTPDEFSFPILTSSNLPLIVINTPNEIPDEPKINGSMDIIHHDSGERNFLGDYGNEYRGEVGVEIRGSTSSYLFSKKSYGLETRDEDGDNNNVSLFGMPKENDWALHGPFSDKTLMRNVLTMELGRRTGRWAPRTQFCELIINGDYRGVYVFMEKIKRDEGRVDISKLKEEDNSGDELTGGYIFKLDKVTGDDRIAWTSPYVPSEDGEQQTNYLLDYPSMEEITPTQLDYIENHVTDFEDAIYGNDPTHPFTGYKNYIDVPSFLDYILTTELCKNVDGYRISTYLYKEKDSKGGKIHAGPLWDYNIAWGNVDYCGGNITSGWELDFNETCPDDERLNPGFWSRMIEVDTSFANALHCRWRELRAGPWHTDAILAFIDEQVELLEEAQQRNLDRWSEMKYYVWPNAFVGNSYSQEIQYLENWTLQRLEFMDNFMFGECGNSSRPNTPLYASAYPNPARESITFDMYGIGQKLFVYNSTGHLMYQEAILNAKVTLDVRDFPAGMYYYIIGNTENLSMQGKFVVL